MKRPRRPFPDEFKQEAVRLLNEQRLPRSQVARNLGIDPQRLRRSARERVSRHAAVPGLGVGLLRLLRLAAAQPKRTGPTRPAADSPDPNYLR
jgi:transposase-like protein